MNISEKIKLLDRYLSIETVNDTNEKEKEIIHLINEITDELIQSYEFQRTYIASLLDVYERHNLKGLSYLLFLFQELYSKYLKSRIVQVDMSLTEREVDDDRLLFLLKSVFESHSKVGNKEVHLFDNFELDMPTNDKKDFIRVTNFIVNGLAEKDILSNDDIQNLLLNLTFARNILRSLKKTELFYFFIETFFDLLFKNEKFQLSRDLGESCLICGYKDNLQELAYFQSFKIYSNTASAIPALHYGICSLKFALGNAATFDHQFKSFIWNLVKFYRNIKLYPYAIKIYESRPKSLTFSTYEEHHLTHTYFLTLLKLENESLPQILAEYLDKSREEIIEGGEVEVLPWLNTLHMIVLKFNESISGVSECKQYIEIFKRIVDPEKLKKNIDIATGSSVNTLINYLKKSLLNLAETRNEIDFTTDNSSARLIANSLLRKSFLEENIDGYLYAMIINSDYSLKFKSREAVAVAAMNSYRTNFSEAYFTAEEIFNFIKSTSVYSFVWLGSDGEGILPLLYCNGNFTFDNKSAYYIDAFKNWFSNNIDLLPFEKDKIIPGGLKAEKQNVDYSQEEKQLSDDLLFTSIGNHELKNILVVKDYELSEFPHNLLLNESGEFFISMTPIMNIMSLEWLLSKDKTQNEEIHEISKGIWIPTAVGDFTLNYLYSYIEDTLKDYRFLEETDILPKNPLNNTINIVAAHGDQSINTFPALFAKGASESFSIVNLNRVIGNGKILIFFVCHSGSMKTDFLRNRISTIVRDYLKAGYEAVIAPFWALDISIPKFWMPAFLDSLMKGNTVIQASHDGNMKVREEFPTPKAYACLHAYGNPFFTIKSIRGNRK